MPRLDWDTISWLLVTMVLGATLAFILWFIVARLSTNDIVLSPNTWECTKLDSDYVDMAIIGKTRIVINENSCVVYTRRAR